jgi:hypothetical protein
MKAYLLFLMASALACAAGAQTRPGDYAWRAPLELPANAGLARAELPAGALARLQSADARDVRVFNAGGEAVPFSWIAQRASPTKANEERTRSYAALPLYAQGEAAPKPKDSMQVRIDGRNGAVWVRLDGTEPPGSRRLDSALFATRGEQRPMAAIEVQGTWPANVPVRVTASTSADLASWTPLPLRGRLYRFEGPDAPTNLRLTFDAPADWKDRYLRLDWSGQDGVAIASVTGIVASPAAAPHRVRAELPSPKQIADDAIEIDTGFATPIAALAIETPRDNTLVPVRVLGRNDASQAWRQLGQTVVYRIGPEGERVSNPPLALHGASIRFLRIQSSNGVALSPAQLHASAEFDPPRLIFVASGSGPYVLAAGHPRAESAALPAATITGMLGAKKIEDVPLATVGAAVVTPQAAGPFDWLPGAPGRRAVLWAVLVAGVVLLGVVAWSLLRKQRDMESR